MGTFNPSALAWIKARRSYGSNACVEVAPIAEGGVAVRHSKDPQGPVLRYTLDEFDAFVDGAKKGEFDHLLVTEEPARS